MAGSGVANLEATIAKLEAATQRAREATREANASTKAANQARRDAEAAEAKLKGMVERLFDESFGEIAHEKLDEFGDTVRGQIDKNTDRVIAVFDDLLAACMIGGPASGGLDLRAALPDHVRARGIDPTPTLSEMAGKRDLALRLAIASARMIEAASRREGIEDPAGDLAIRTEFSAVLSEAVGS